MARSDEGKKSGPLFVDILACINTARRRTDGAIVKKLGGTRRCISESTRGLWAAGLIYPAAWRRNSHSWVPVWAIGAKPAAIHPTRGTVFPTLRPGIELLAFANLWKELAQPSTHKCLEEASGYGRVTVGFLLRRARGHGLVRIDGWLRPVRGGGLAPLYLLGGSPDEPKPAPRPRSEMQKEYEARVSVRRATAGMLMAFKRPAHEGAATV